MSEGHDSIHCIKDDGMINHTVVIQFTKVLDLCNSALIVFELILLQANYDVFQEIVNDRRDKVLVISIQSTGEDCKKMNIAVLYFAGFREDLLQDSNNLLSLESAHAILDVTYLSLFPVESPNLLEDSGVVTIVHIQVH